MSAPTALRILKRTVRVLAFAFLAPVALAVAWYFAASDGPVDWRTARSDSTGQAPSAENTPDAVIQVYAARAFRWRGAFGVHTWVATKHTGADHYVRYEVMGFGLRQGAARSGSTRRSRTPTGTASVRSCCATCGGAPRSMT